MNIVALSEEQIRFVFNDHKRMNFVIFHENICCGYSFEASRRGASNEYPQHVFSWRNKKNISYFYKKKSPYLYFCSSNKSNYFNLD